MAEREGQRITNAFVDKIQKWAESEPVAECFRLLRANAIDVITAAKDDGGTDSRTRPENGQNVAKSDAELAIRWCADRGYALDEADQAWVRDVWGVR